jgi:ABC-type uncharacterized transport system substrate-binding protein
MTAVQVNQKTWPNHKFWTRALGPLTVMATLAAALPAQAHPHIWVSVETTVLFDKGTVTGLRHRWLFDEYYSQMAVQGLDSNHDGIYSRKDLAELTQVNMDGLRETSYFTVAKLGPQDLTFGPPQDYWLEHVAVDEPPGPSAQVDDQRTAEQQATDKKAADSKAAADAKPGLLARVMKMFSKTATPAAPPKPKVLALEYTLPLSTPVLTSADGFTFSVYDPDFMIWFDMAKKTSAKLAAGAPKGCELLVEAPKATPDEQNLSDALSGQLGGIAGGAGMAKTVALKCAKI